jgi:hypothetical protein
VGIGVREAFDVERREAAEFAIKLAVAHREHNPCRLCSKATTDKRQRL